MLVPLDHPKIISFIYMVEELTDYKDFKSEFVLMH